MRLSRRACLLSFGLGGLGLGLPATAGTAFSREIIVRTIKNLRTQTDVDRLVGLAADYGVTTVNLAVKQDEDDEVASGLVFYASARAPRAPGYETFDVLSEIIRAAHARGLEVRAWMPQFHDQMAVRANPAWQMQAYDGHRAAPFTGRGRTEYFVNPVNPAARDYQRFLVSEVARNYDVDGIVIDWVRFDDYNMDLGNETRAQFRAATGIDPITIDFASDNPQRARWNAWRTALIADHVRRLREEVRRDVAMGAYILPPAFVEVAQDAAQFSAFVDFLSPMAYYSDWGFDPRWVDRELLPQTVARAGAAAVIPVLDEDWSDAAAREVIPEIRSTQPAISRLSWFAYGRWTERSFQRLVRLAQF
jgi:uncharacterized lipoprotein YddW (UPF0748 family)